jgi:hypothetical protein
MVMIAPEVMTAIAVVIGLAVTSVPGTVALGTIEAVPGGPSTTTDNATTDPIGITVRTEAMTPTATTGRTEVTVPTVTTGQVVTVRTVVTVAARSTGRAGTTGQHATVVRPEGGTPGTGAGPTRAIVPGAMTVVATTARTATIGHVPTTTVPMTAPTAGRTGSAITATATPPGMVVRGVLTGSSVVARTTGPVGTTGRGVTIGRAAAMPGPRTGRTGASPNEPRIGPGRSPIARSAPIVMLAQLGGRGPPRVGTAAPRTASAGRPRGSIGRTAHVASSAAIRTTAGMIVSGSPPRRCPRASNPSSWTRRCVGTSLACARRSPRR